MHDGYTLEKQRVSRPERKRAPTRVLTMRALERVHQRLDPFLRCGSARTVSSLRGRYVCIHDLSLSLYIYIYMHTCMYVCM